MAGQAEFHLALFTTILAEANQTFFWSQILIMQILKTNPLKFTRKLSDISIVVHLQTLTQDRRAGLAIIVYVATT